MKKAPCEIYIGLNSLGMIMFSCKTHGIDDVDPLKRCPLAQECQETVVNAFHEIFERNLRSTKKSNRKKKNVSRNQKN